MLNVDVSPEIIRLAQQKVRGTGISLTDEVARLIVQEAIFGLDPELGLVLDDQDSLSEIDALTELLGS